MVKIDFTSYTTLQSCPAWWRAFIREVTRDCKDSWERSHAIDRALEENKCLAIDNPFDTGNLICLVFESEDAFGGFVTYWILRCNEKENE